MSDEYPGAPDVVIATGQVWRSRLHRVGVFDVRRPTPVLLEDAWVDAAGEAAIRERLEAEGRRVRTAEYDDWGDGGWTRLWTDDREAFCSWTPEGPSWRASGADLIDDHGRSYPLASFVLVDHEVERGWMDRWVRLRRTTGDPLVVFHDHSDQPLADPSYDGVALDEETSVMRAFAAALSRGTGIPKRVYIG